MKEQRVYLASPYSNPGQSVQDCRHRRALQLTAAQLKAGRGVFRPIVNGMALTEGGCRLWKARAGVRPQLFAWGNSTGHTAWPACQRNGGA